MTKIVYRGETIITDFDPDDLERLEAILAPFVELDPGEQLYVSPRGEGALVVQKLRKEEL